MIDAYSESQLRRSVNGPWSAIAHQPLDIFLLWTRNQAPRAPMGNGSKPSWAFLYPAAMRASVLGVIIILISLSYLAVSPAFGDDSDDEVRLHPHQSLLASEQAVEAAWDAFHRAALGGTLASPQLQMEIESALTQARELLMKARKANKEGRDHEVSRLSGQIWALCDSIISKSRRTKP